MNTEKLTAVLNLMDQHGIEPYRIDAIVEVGSTAHGISAGHDDLDIIAIQTETLREIITNPTPKNRMIRTQPEGHKSGPGDIDINLYTMRKFVWLCEAGNPTIINVLFTRQPLLLFNNFVPLTLIAELTYSQRAGDAFMGYMNQQIKRWEEGGIGKRVSRPTLIKEYGYDTKYAAHAIRLGIQGAEYMEKGTITIPVVEPWGAKLRSIRAGAVHEKEAFELALQAKAMLDTAITHTQAPPQPNKQGIEDFLFWWHGR